MIDNSQMQLIVLGLGALVFFFPQLKGILLPLIPVQKNPQNQDNTNIPDSAKEEIKSNLTIPLKPINRDKLNCDPIRAEAHLKIFWLTEYCRSVSDAASIDLLNQVSANLTKLPEKVEVKV